MATETYTFENALVLTGPKVASIDLSNEIENNAYAKFWRANKVHYGKCGSGVYLLLLLFFDISGSRIILGNNHVFRFNFPDQGRVECTLQYILRR